MANPSLKDVDLRDLSSANLGKLTQLKTILSDVVLSLSTDADFTSVQRQMKNSGYLDKVLNVVAQLESPEEEETPSSAMKQDILNDCASIISFLCGPTSRGPVVRTFSISDSLKISIREAAFVEADMGWKIWDSARVMSKMILEGKIDVKQHLILELGCGPGLLGIVIAKLGGKVIMTDYQEKTLENALFNIQANHCDENADVLKLDWRDLDGCDFTKSKFSKEKTPKFQTIVATDVVYEPGHGKLVSGVVSQLLSDDGVFYCCVENRERESFAQEVENFMGLMQELGFLIACQIIEGKDSGNHLDVKSDQLYFKFTRAPQ